MLYRRFWDLPSWGTRSSFSDLERMRQQMSRLFDAMSEGQGQTARAGVFPLINLTESNEKYFVRAELPGVKAEDLDIQATAKGISLSGQRKIPDEQNEARYHRRERDAGRFSRMIGLPGDIDTEKVNASLTDGILTIEVPKAETAKPRQIKVE